MTAPSVVTRLYERHAATTARAGGHAPGTGVQAFSQRLGEAVSAPPPAAGGATDPAFAMLESPESTARDGRLDTRRDALDAPRDPRTAVAEKASRTTARQTDRSGEPPRPAESSRQDKPSRPATAERSAEESGTRPTRATQGRPANPQRGVATGEQAQPARTRSPQHAAQSQARFSPAIARNGATAPSASVEPVASGRSGSIASQLARALVLPGGAEGRGQPAAAVPAGDATAQNARRAARPETPPTPAQRGKSNAAASPERSGKSSPTPFDKLVASMRLRGGAKRSTARILLNPPSLGRIRVQARLEGDRLEVDIRTETDDARKLIHHRSSVLRSALHEQGIAVDQFRVSSEQAATDAWMPFNEGASADREGSGRWGTGGHADDRGDAPGDDTRLEGQEHGTVAERRVDVRI